MQTINSVSRYCGGLGVGQCIVDFGEYSQLPNTTFINTYTPIETPNAGAPHQCTWYACERINQLTGLGLSGAMGNGNTWWEGARDRGFTYYTSTTEALAAKGTLAGLVPSGVIGVSTNHVAVCERYDEDGTVYLSEMWGDADNNGTVRLCKYNISEISAYWIDFNVEASGGGGYIKKKLLEGKDFCWKSPPVEEGKGIPYQKDDMLPTKEKYGEFLKLLNDAQELAKVKEDKRINFSADQDEGILTAKRFNQYLYLMQESKEGNLKGVDDKVEKMKEVKAGDILRAEHFNKLAELFNHWKYGYLVDFHNAVMNEIWAFFADREWQPAAIAGVMGNMQQEVGANFNPDIYNGTGDGGFGLCQWTGSRRTSFEAYFSSHPELNRTSVSGQLTYLMYELKTMFANNSRLQNLKNETDVVRAAKIWFYDYEACTSWGAYVDGTGPVRIANAEQIYAMAMSSGTEGDGIFTGSFGWPFRGGAGIVTCEWGVPTIGGPHLGIDIDAGAGTDILAVEGGVVIASGYAATDPSYGNEVVISHGGICTRYAHMSRIYVNQGNKISKGQPIGAEGATGRVTGPHLHLEVRIGGLWGQTVNPRNYLHR